MRSSIIAAAVLSLAALAACGSDPQKNCEDACAQEAKCNKMTANCSLECTQIMADAKTNGCTDQADAYNVCAAGDTECKGDAACGVEQEAFIKCMAK